MRTVVVLKMVLLVTVALWAGAGSAAAGEAERAMAEARAALATEPPQRDVARRAMLRATAAGDDKQAVGEAYFRLGVLEEEEQAFVRALSDYRACIAAAPNAPGAHWARNASMRVQWLSARSEGGFAPLIRVQQAKRDPTFTSNPEAVERLARDAEDFPPGAVRAETRLFIAGSWMGLRRPKDALLEFRRVADDPTSDGPSKRVAERGVVDAALAGGQLDAAAKEVQGHAIQLDPLKVIEVERLVRRRALLRGARIELAAFVGLVAFALVYAWQKSASSTIWGVMASARVPVRVAGVLLCITSAVAVAFVLLEAFASRYLERFGL